MNDVLITGVLGLLVFQSKPKLEAVQEWKKSKPERAWTPDGTLLPKVISVDRGEGGLLERHAIELVATVHCDHADEFPSAYWRIGSGLKGFYESTGWRNGDSGSGLAALSLTGFPIASEAIVDLFLASGRRQMVAHRSAISINHWTNLSNGFRVILLNESYKDETGELGKRARLEVVPPKRFVGWDLAPTLQAGKLKLKAVAYESQNGRQIFRFESASAEAAPLSITGRPYVRYRFPHIRLRPINKP